MDADRCYAFGYKFDDQGSPIAIRPAEQAHSNGDFISLAIMRISIEWHQSKRSNEYERKD
jgi:hypothetical protein